MESTGGQNAVPTEQPFGHLIREHSGRFERLEKENSDLRERIGELEATMNQISPLISRMDADLYNHGQEGLKTKFVKFMADDEATKRTQKEMHKANTARLNWVIALLSLLCAILMVLIAWRGMTKTSKLIDPLHSHIPETVIARMR